MESYDSKKRRILQRFSEVVQRHQLVVQRHTYSGDLLTLAIRGRTSRRSCSLYSLESARPTTHYIGVVLTSPGGGATLVLVLPPSAKKVAVSV